MPEEEKQQQGYRSRDDGRGPPDNAQSGHPEDTETRQDKTQG